MLCVDKTGTLTQNRMAVAALCIAGQELDVQNLPVAADGSALPDAFHELLEYAVLASEIEPHDPMEQAFHRMAADHLVDTEHLHPAWSLAREYELSPQLLAMSHLWRDGTSAHDTVATKGAPEAVADLCHLPDAERASVSAQAARLADRGLRVLGVAKAQHRTQDTWPDAQHDFDFEWLGLVALADPLRPEVPQAVAQCRQAGIRVVMITGDHPRTARAIAAQAGIANDRVITGDELAQMPPQELADQVQQVSVFARIKPHQKLALVEALKAQGEVVAMTGDGVNDAPALKAAHIGIAMGQRGTDVAREAAALVLLHDDFAAIVLAIHRGRQTFANLRQAMVYTLAVHVPIIGLALLPVLFGLPLVLAPLHIAFLELVIDPACSIVFEAEEGAADLMQQPPRGRRTPAVRPPHPAERAAGQRGDGRRGGPVCLDGRADRLCRHRQHGSFCGAGCGQCRAHPAQPQQPDPLARPVGRPYPRQPVGAGWNTGSVDRHHHRALAGPGIQLHTAAPGALAGRTGSRPVDGRAARALQTAVATDWPLSRRPPLRIR